MAEQYVYRVSWSRYSMYVERFLLEKKTDKSVVVWEGPCKRTYKINSLDQSFFFNKEEAVEFATNKAKETSEKLNSYIARLEEFIKDPKFRIIEKSEPDKYILTEDNFV